MRTWQNTDKSNWKEGAWHNEPDKAQWIDPETGFDCLIVRNRWGALCGYVGIPKDHKYYETHYDNVFQENGDYIDVHGGLTFSNKCQQVEDESHGICHKGHVANKNVWWLGFDCAHLGDKCPLHDFGFDEPETYKTFGYVKYEVERLARQLSAITNTKQLKH